MKKPARKRTATTGTTTPKPGKRARFLHKANCTTCRKARKFMERRGYKLQFRDLGQEPLSAAELEKLIGNREHTEFLNPRNELYRQKKMKDKAPSRREAISLMAKNPNLIRRPVILAGGRVVLGFDEKGMARF